MWIVTQDGSLLNLDHCEALRVRPMEPPAVGGEWVLEAWSAQRSLLFQRHWIFIGTQDAVRGYAEGLKSLLAADSVSAIRAAGLDVKIRDESGLAGSAMPSPAEPVLRG